MRVLAPLIVVLAACSDDGIGPDPGVDEEGTQTLVFGQVVFTDTLNNVIAYSHCDHWHGSIRIRESQPTALRLWFVEECQADHGAPPREAWFSLDDEPEYSVRVQLQDPTIAVYLGERHHFRLEPRRVGSSPSSVVVRRNGRVVYRDPTYPTAVEP